MNKKSKMLKLTAPLLCSALLFACNQDSDVATSTGNASQTKNKYQQDINTIVKEKVTFDGEDTDTEWENNNPTYIELNEQRASFDSSAAIIVKDRVLTIKTSGVYVLSGKIDDGQIIVDTEDKGTVRLVLNGVEINSSDHAPIYVKDAEKTIITLQEGTKNYISDGKEYTFKDSSTAELSATIYSKDNLTINGTGKLIVHGNYKNGITSKDELRITDGVIQITAVDDGMLGRDLLAINNGKISIEAGGDGLKSSNDKDSTKGIIALEGGSFDIHAGSDGIQAETSLYITGGSYKINSGGGSPEQIKNNSENMREPAENPAMNTEDTDSQSAKGLKAANEIAITGGTFNIDAADDATHSNNLLTIAGGDFLLASGDDGIHADSSVLIAGGTINISKSYEGIESKIAKVIDGKIDINASDDGVNIAGGNDDVSVDEHAVSEDNQLTINGGSIYVNANGDGIDSNGSINMTDGVLIVNGPTANNNGSLDYNGSFEMSGGYFIAAGSAGMAQATSEQSAQNAIIMTYPKTQAAGTVVHLEDSKGNTITTFAPNKDYQSIVISSPKLVKDTAYSLFSGGTSSGKQINGLYNDGEYKSGTKVVDFTIADTVTWLNETGVTTAKSSGPGGFPPDGDQNRPTENPMFDNLDEATRDKVEAIMEQERVGAITREEAHAQLEALGIIIPEKRNRP